MKSSQQMANMKMSEYIHIWIACCLHPALRRSARCHCGSQECPAIRTRNRTLWGLICLSTRTNKEGKAKQDSSVMMAQDSHTFEIIWLKTSTYYIYICIYIYGYWITWYNISISIRMPNGWVVFGYPTSIPRCHKELLRGAESKEAAEVLLKITGIAQCFKNLEIFTGI